MYSANVEWNPLVSITIPVYNGANYLREAIDSALAQTYKNIEILVVDDGSTDGGATKAIAESYGDAIRYIHKENGGVATALNRGIEAMRGDFFSWLSHDDCYPPDKIEKQIGMLREAGRDDLVLFGDYTVVNKHGAPQYDVCMNHALLVQKPLYAVFSGALNGCTMLIPRVAFATVGLFNPLPTTQDYDMWDRMIRHLEFLHMPEILLYSRVHPEQTSRDIQASEEADQMWLRLMEKLTPEELASMEDSSQAFYEKMVTFFSDKPYPKAREYAFTRCNLDQPFSARRFLVNAIKRCLKACGLFPLARRCKLALMRRRAAFPEDVAPNTTLYFSVLSECEKGRDVAAVASVQLHAELIALHKNFPQVSVILPTYNRAHSLPVALASLASQGYQNLEVIVVDDGSTDATDKVCETYARYFGSKFRYFRLEENRGVSHARNRGIELARGDLVTFLDSDDWYFPDKIAQQVAALAKHKYCRLCTSFYTTTRNWLDVQSHITITWDKLFGLYPDFLNPSAAWLATPAVMTYRSVLEELGGFDESMDCCEDLDLWARITEKYSNCVIPASLVVVSIRDAFRFKQGLLARHALYSKVLARDPDVPQDRVNTWLKNLCEDYRKFNGKGFSQADDAILLDLIEKADRLPMHEFLDEFGLRVASMTEDLALLADSSFV